MIKLPFVIVKRKIYKSNMDRLDSLDSVLDKCSVLEERLKEAKKTIEDMKCGNLMCGEHCESCKNAFVSNGASVYGPVIRTHCKLKAANTCAGYQPIDPA